MSAYREYDPAKGMPNIDHDALLIHEAAILAGRINADELLAEITVEEFRLLLREMRAETEAIRLARRIAQHCGTEAPVVQSPCV